MGLKNVSHFICAHSLLHQTGNRQDIALFIESALLLLARF